MSSEDFEKKIESSVVVRMAETEEVWGRIVFSPEFFFNWNIFWKQFYFSPTPQKLSIQKMINSIDGCLGIAFALFKTSGIQGKDVFLILHPFNTCFLREFPKFDVDFKVNFQLLFVAFWVIIEEFRKIENGKANAKQRDTLVSGLIAIRDFLKVWV